MNRNPLCITAMFLGTSLLGLPDTGYGAILSFNVASSGIRLSSSEEDAQKAGAQSLSGTVLDPSGAAIAGAEVILLSGDGKELFRINSDKDGSFRFEKLPAG